MLMLVAFMSLLFLIAAVYEKTTMLCSDDYLISLPNSVQST